MSGAVDFKHLLRLGIESKRLKCLVAVDQVSDPQNLGSLFRAVCAAGAEGIIIPKSGTSPVNETVKKVSVGTADLVPYSMVTNLSRALAEAKKAGYWVVGTTSNKSAKSLYQTEIPPPALLIAGGEGFGMRRLTEEACDILVHIPMLGEAESLNVSQAMAVVLFELVRRSQS